MNFYGTALYLFSAKRDNHGAYSATFDGDAPMTYDGFSEQNQFQVLLASKTDLELGVHSFTLTNGAENGKFVGIDFIVFTAGDGCVCIYHSYAND